MYRREIRSFILDGDALRKGINRDLDFSPSGRDENIRRMGEIAKLLMQAGVVTIVAAISPYREHRRYVRKLFEGDRFYEIYVKCGIHTCMQRDPKGMYAKAHQGIIPDFTGVGMSYEEPLEPNLIVDTDGRSVDSCREQLLQFLKEMEMFGDA